MTDKHPGDVARSWDETRHHPQRALREKIEQYQEELAPEAARVFLRVIGLRATELTPTASQEITAQEQETEQLAAVATFMREHLQAMLTMQDHTSLRLEHAIQLLETLIEQQESTTTKLAQIDERTQRLTPAHTRDVQLKVERIARKMNQQTPTITLEKARAITYGRLKTRFGAGSYKEINDDWYSKVAAYLNEEYSKASGGEQLPEQGSLFQQERETQKGKLTAPFVVEGNARFLKARSRVRGPLLFGPNYGKVIDVFEQEPIDGSFFCDLHFFRVSDFSTASLSCTQVLHDSRAHLVDKGVGRAACSPLYSL